MSEKSMKQLSLAETGFLPKRGKVTRKAEFLAEMNTRVRQFESKNADFSPPPLSV